MNPPHQIMTTETEDLASAGFTQMIDYLENLLIRQLEKLRKYDLDAAIVLAEEANTVAMALAREKVLDQPSHIEHRRRIQKLYRDISLVISTERSEVAQKLSAIRKGIKVLGMSR
ncbi:MAG: hypothetical protein JW828_14150 [Sedimentisphaerales bacterium]|nr:hypothetical protein [Sedimentisphaerales bacterium]